jgi:hypothetical protein
VLHAAAPQFLARDDLAAVAATPAVLVGGGAVFELHLYDGTTRLHGSGGVSASVHEGVDVAVLPEIHGEARDWLYVSPQVPGNHEIRLACAGEQFATTVVAAVEDDAIAEVRLHGGEDDAADGAWVPLVARAYGQDREPIHGVTFAWDVAGELADERGELWRYRVDRDERQTLAVRYGAHEVGTTIHAAKK